MLSKALANALCLLSKSALLSIIVVSIASLQFRRELGVIATIAYDRIIFVVLDTNFTQLQMKSRSPSMSKLTWSVDLWPLLRVQTPCFISAKPTTNVASSIIATTVTSGRLRLQLQLLVLAHPNNTIFRLNYGGKLHSYIFPSNYNSRLQKTPSAETATTTEGICRWPISKVPTKLSKTLT